MKKALIGLVVVVLLLAGTGVVLARDAVGIRNGSVLAAPSEATALTGAQYLDKQIVVKVALAEGKYVVALAALTTDVYAVMYEGGTKSYVTGTDEPWTINYSFNELTPERLKDLRVTVYAASDWSLVKKPILALRFDGPIDPMKCETIAEFRNYLMPPAPAAEK
jgi:hypothetical protein